MTHQFNEIETNRRILSSGITEITGLSEYYNPIDDTRFILVPIKSAVVGQHRELASRGFSVFEEVGIDERGVRLEVPKGTKRLSRAMIALSRKPQDYNAVFSDIGQIVAQVEDAQNEGVVFNNLEGRTLLDSLAFTTGASQAEFGASVKMIPPYSPLYANIDLTEEELSKELGLYRLFRQPAIQEIVRIVRKGYEEFSSDVNH